MPEKTKTIVVIESHEHTIIRRSRRVISSELLKQEVSAGVPEAPVTRDRRWLGGWWQRVTQKRAKIFTPLKLRLRVGSSAPEGRDVDSPSKK